MFDESNLSWKVQRVVPHAIPFFGVGFRNVAQRYATAQDVLSTKGSLIAGGRYNFKGAFEDTLSLL